MDTVLGQSVASGSVKKQAGGDGFATLSMISGMLADRREHHTAAPTIRWQNFTTAIDVLLSGGDLTGTIRLEDLLKLAKR